MKAIKLAGLCLAAIFAVSLVASTAASAASWKRCVEGAGGTTKYETSQCNHIGSTNKYEWVTLGGTEKVIASATLTLKDTNTPTGTVAVTCSGTDEGAIGPTKYARIETIAVASCTEGEGCGKLVRKAEPVNLPWQTELFETEKALRDLIVSAIGKGPVGWKVTCTIGGIETADECTGETDSTLMTDTKGMVLATFESKSGKPYCTVGGPESGEVLGTNAIWAAANAIRVS